MTKHFRMVAAGLMLTLSLVCEVAQAAGVLTIGRREDSTTFDPIKSAERRDSQPAHSLVSPSPPENLLRPWNRNCPAAVGWDAAGSVASPVRPDTGAPFMVGERAFYHPQRRNDYYALCAGEHAYLYSGSHRERGYALAIE